MPSVLSQRLLGLTDSEEDRKKQSSSSLEWSQTDYNTTSSFSSGNKKAPSPPGVIDLLSHHRKRSETTQKTKSSKRCKIEELNHLAFSAKADISRGGLHYPVIRTKSPRMLPDDIDATTVELLKSSDLDGPFVNIKTAFDVGAYSAASDIRELVGACNGFYSNAVGAEEQRKTQNSSEDSESTTSSVTDGETEDPNAARRSRDPAGFSALKNSDGSLISIVDALAICDKPRLVVLSNEPWTIVHVNAAFMRVSGLEAAGVLGKTVRDIIKCTIQSEAEGTHPLIQLTGKVVTLHGSVGKEIPCHVNITAVGSDTKAISHVSIGLVPTQPVQAYEPDEDFSLGFSVRVMA